jgi:hypothetical protein
MLEGSALSQWVNESSWGYYSILAVHAVGMAAVVGGTMILCLRILGLAKGLPVVALERLRLVAWGGFLINAISGSIIFCSNGVKLISDWTFQTKMACIVLGGFALWALWRTIDPNKNDGGYEYGLQAKFIAFVTLVLWIGAVLAGRYVAYSLDS